jgi:hypothetical protein
MDIETITTIFLIAVFVSTEVFRIITGRKGTIVALKTDETPLLLFNPNVVVRLRSGEEISAGVDCCTACLGKLKTGDRVKVVKSKNGYQVNLPWIVSRDCHQGFGD